jgi:dolichyl-phosphate beta-glucosyltransferase
MLTSHVAIVIPCYNERQRLNLAAFEEFLLNASVDFVFVDDGSTDGTSELLESLRNRRPDRVEILVFEKNQGKGEAVRQGIEWALERKFDFVGFWDSDLATPLYAIQQLMEIFEKYPQIDLILGSRVQLLGHNVRRRAVRHYLGRIFATVVSLLLRLPVYDTQCGAKIFRVVPETRELTAQRFKSRWVFDVELIQRFISRTGSAARAAARMYEYPLDSWNDVAGSKVKPLDFLIAFRDVVRIYLAYRRS